MKIPKQPISMLRRQLEDIFVSLDLEHEYGLKSYEDERKWNKQFGIASLLYLEVNKIENLIDKFNNING